MGVDNFFTPRHYSIIPPCLNWQIHEGTVMYCPQVLQFYSITKMLTNWSMPFFLTSILGTRWNCNVLKHYGTIQTWFYLLTAGCICFWHSFVLLWPYDPVSISRYQIFDVLISKKKGSHSWKTCPVYITDSGVSVPSPHVFLHTSRDVNSSFTVIHDGIELYQACRRRWVNG